jgi:hypothetical protein
MCRCCFRFYARRVAPQVFQAVEGALVSVKDVDNHLQVVEHHPLAGRKSVDRYWSKRMVFTQARFDFVCNRFQLRLRRAGANHKKIRKRRDIAQVQYNDVLGLFVRGEFRAGLC